MTFVNSMAHQWVSGSLRHTDNQIFVRFRSLISGIKNLRMTDPNNVKICHPVPLFRATRAPHQ
jgi:hypothetical protein